MENGYENDFDEKNYPSRVFNAKPKNGLVTFMQTFDRDLEYICRGAVQGFLIFLTAPGETFRTPRHPIRVPYLEQVEILIKPRLYITSNGLRRYSANERQCFFQSERQLSFFKSYSKRKCELECLTNYTKIQCGCVTFSMPSWVRSN